MQLNYLLIKQLLNSGMVSIKTFKHNFILFLALSSLLETTMDCIILHLRDISLLNKSDEFNSSNNTKAAKQFAASCKN